MVDSDLKAIQDKMVEHVLDSSTTIQKCGYGLNLDEKVFPYAEVLFFSGGTIDSDISHTLDRPITAQIRVYAHSADEIEYALEILMKHWYDSTRLGDLHDLGVIAINPATTFNPIKFRGDTTQPLFGDIYFVLTVRYNYT